LRIFGCALSLSLTIGIAAFAQSPPARPQFEAVSIKPTAPGARGGGGQVLPGGKLVGRNVTLKYLMTVAYSVTNYQIFGSADLLETQTYDVNAEAGGPVDTAQIRLMLQSALEDQLKLKVHRETRELPIYSLNLAKPGSLGAGLVEDSSGDCAAAVTPQTPPPGAPNTPIVPCGNVNLNPLAGRINGRRGRILQLVDRLSSVVGRPVVDKTGLTGFYNISLNWTPDPTLAQAAATPAANDSLGPSLFTAVQEQLGLKLESSKGPVEVIVLDSAVKLPQ
jgi:uncharacterized protein (TIGR03435 family)